MSAVYNLRTTDNGYAVTKFDDDFNIESSYEMTIDNELTLHCGCPAGGRPTCRHREMFKQLSTRANTGWFLDFDTRQWVDPTGEAASAENPDIIAEIPLREVHEESHEYKPTTTLPDSHPFRRRM